MKCIHFEFTAEDLPDSAVGQIFFLSAKCECVDGYPHLEIGNLGDGILARIYTLK